MKTLLIILLTLSVNALNAKTVEENIEEYRRMLPGQQNVIYNSYHAGKRFDYGFSMMAIAWKESLGGLYTVNLQDPSCGIFHNNINTVLKRHPEITDSDFSRNVLCVKLQEDIGFALEETKKELDFWKKYHKSNWNKVWSSYNGGFRGNPEYSDDIKNKIKAFKIMYVNNI